MPAEPTKAAQRRLNRRETEDLKFDSGHAREIESKRNRGEISCAECRRLKIKCDRAVPCNACIRRGCGSLCPNGSLSTGQGTRFVLAATEHLHKRIARVNDRVRQLEDALSSLQAKHYTEPHPLLRDDLLIANIAHDLEEVPGFVDDVGLPSNTPEVIEAFGTLSISDNGVSRFFGPTGGPESLLMGSTTSLHSSSPGSTPDSLRNSRSPSSLPGDLTMFSQSFPFTPMGPVVAVQEIIEDHLPNWERAVYLAETFLEQAGWLFRGVTRQQLMEEMLPIFYKQNISASFQSGSESDDYSGPHDLALIFTVFAVGALVDLRQDPSNAEAEHYHQIARAAICLQPVLEKPSLVTIQALHLLSIYNAMSSNESGSNNTSMETTWSLVTLAGHLSQTIGLHRDSARWGLSPKMVERRRVLFWDLFVADAWQSLSTGRPPSFSLEYVDCRFPQDDDQTLGSDGKIEPGNGSWGFRFAMDCVADVAARTLTAEAPSYAIIMDLDRKVREFPGLQATTTPTSNERPSPSIAMMRCVFSHIREVILLYIHRSFFAQAVIEHPMNPLLSPYAASFLAAYRASSTILRTIREHFSVQPALCSRFWSMWTYAFSAAVVFGTIVTRGPRSPLASNAMTELDQAFLLFTQAARHSHRAARALSIITTLRQKAQMALAAVMNEQSPEGHLGSSWDVQVKQEESDGKEDELAIFAGCTRFVSSQRRTESLRSFTSHRVSTTNLSPFPSSHYSSSPLSAISSRASATPSSASSSNSPWGSEYHTEEYLAPSQNTHIPSPIHLNTQSYQPPLQYQPESLSTSPSYHWSHNQVLPTQYYDDTSQQYQPPSHQVHLPQQVHTVQPIRQPAYPLQTHTQPSQLRYKVPDFSDNLALPTPAELAHMGLAARDSRLDARWTSFMQDSGLLGGTQFDPHTNLQ